MFQATEGRWGSREAEITGVELVGEDGQPAHVFFSGERVEIACASAPTQPLTDFVVGIGIFNLDGVCAFGTNTNIEDLKADRLEGEGTVSFHIDGLDLVAGTYKLDVALHKLDGYPYDYHRLLYSFRVKSRTQDAGIYRPRHGWGFRAQSRSATRCQAEILETVSTLLPVSHLALRDPQQFVQPERLRQPAAPAFGQEPLGVGADHVAGHEQDPREHLRVQVRRSTPNSWMPSMRGILRSLMIRS